MLGDESPVKNAVISNGSKKANVRSSILSSTLSYAFNPSRKLLLSHEMRRSARSTREGARRCSSQNQRQTMHDGIVDHAQLSIPPGEKSPIALRRLRIALGMVSKSLCRTSSQKSHLWLEWWHSKTFPCMTRSNQQQNGVVSDKNRCWFCVPQ